MRQRRGKRLYRKSDRRQLWTLWATVAVFLLLCLLVSVLVGLLLKKQAEKYIEPKPSFDFSEALYSPSGKKIVSVDAYLYYPGSNVASYLRNGITDLSLGLQDGEGNLFYETGVVLTLPSEAREEEADEEDLLSETVKNIHGSGGRVCAYFYVKAFAVTDPYLQDLRISYEIAVIREAFDRGVDEILLVLPDPTAENIARLESYVSKASFAAGESPVGVLIAPEIFADAESYLASRLASVCDFAALDLRAIDAESIFAEEAETNEQGEELPGALERFLAENEYAIKAYGLRVVLSNENAELYDNLKALGVTNIQVIGN